MGWGAGLFYGFKGGGGGGGGLRSTALEHPFVQTQWKIWSDSVWGGTRASLHSHTVEDLIRLSVGGGGGGTRASLHSHTVEDLIRLSVGGALEHPFIHTVEDLIRIRGQVWKMLMLESVVSGFSRGQRSRRLNYRSWPSEGHVTAMEDSP